MTQAIKIIPNQEVLMVDPPPPPFSVIPYLNAKEGIIRIEDLPNFAFDPERPITCLEFMGEIGVALAEQPRQSDTWDQALDVHGSDFKKASIENLTKRLYFNSVMARHRPDVVTVGGYRSSLEAPGVRGEYEGVAVTGDEFKLIARSPEDLAKHVYANTEEANERRDPEEKLDDETLRNTAGRSIANSMRTRKEMLLRYDERLKTIRGALLMFNRLVAVGPDAEKRPMGEMDLYRLGAAVAIHGTVKVACRQLFFDSDDYGTTARQAIDRTIVSDTHRGEPEVIVAAIKDRTKWAGYYIDAKRGKIYQSLSRCKEEFDRTKHFLKTKKPDNEKLIVT